jgi:hypothetical protein
MAVVAGIRRAEPCRQVGTRDAEAVIVPPVDDHIGALRHVAGRAGEGPTYRLMMVVRSRRVPVGGVALHADAIPGRAKFCGVRLVAIAAGDAGRKHLALLERAVIVDLVPHLAIGMIEAAGQRGDDVGVRQPPPRDPILGEFAASRVAQAAGLDLTTDEGRREVTLRVSGF